MRNVLKRGAAVAAVAAIALGLTACGRTEAATAEAAPTPSAPAASLTVRGPWVKAAGEGAMTAAFGVLVNDTGTDVTVTGVASPLSPMELHEMSMKDGKMVMRPKAGGLVVPAGGTHELAPGGDHLMLMKPAAAVEPGDEVSFTLRLADGTTVPFTAIVKPFAGAQESYDPGSHMPMAPTASSVP